MPAQPCTVSLARSTQCRSSIRSTVALLSGQLLHDRAAGLGNGAAARLRLQTVPQPVIRYRQVEHRVDGRPQELRQAEPRVRPILRRRRVER